MLRSHAGFLVVETLFLLTSIAGVGISLMLTVDSWWKYLRVHAVLNGNHFPRMHLRMDVCLTVVQCIQAVISLVWFSHLIDSDPDVMVAFERLWPIFPLRLTMMTVLVMAQAINAYDRHQMEHHAKVTQAPPLGRPDTRPLPLDEM